MRYLGNFSLRALARPVSMPYNCFTFSRSIRLFRIKNSYKATALANLSECLFSDDRNNIVYCSGLGENYFHEVVHLYLNRLYRESPLVEGIAVFYGGSMGKSLKWHLNRLKIYLREHPEVDLNKLEEFWYMDNYTNPNSTIKGMLCWMAFEKDKIKGLQKLMSYKTMEELYFLKN